MTKSDIISAYLILASLVLGADRCAAQETKNDFPNPYYDSSEWKVWLDDSKPVENAGQTLTAVPPQDRKKIVPRIVDGQPVLKLAELRDSSVGAMWDDVYVNQDNGHSSFTYYWPDAKSPFHIKGQLITARLPLVVLASENNRIVNKGQTDLKKVGANFTSQSTTHMGHHITNSGVQVTALEQEFYFANVLRAGPAHISFREQNSGPVEDLYEALVPSIFNSYGSSGSEMHGLMKMVIAGSFIKTDLKKKIKQHGIYPATLLYIWKKSLPYHVPYAHELRHKVAYFAKGDHSNYSGPTKANFNFEYHAYDENEHLKRMIRNAYALKNAPPISVFSQMENQGGKMIYRARTAALIHQNKEDVVVRFSAKDSYDLSGNKIDFRCVRICGNPKTQIKSLENDSFEVTIPFDPKLPKGRTSILLVANNGSEDSNPAVLNIFNSSGPTNQRPSLEVQPVIELLSGEKVSLPLKSVDPEGFPVETTIRDASPKFAKIENDRLIIQSQSGAEPAENEIAILCSDKTTGSGQNSKSITIKTKPMIAVINSKADSPIAPLTLHLSGSQSKNINSDPIKFSWAIGGFSNLKGMQVAPRIELPGIYKVELSAKTAEYSANAVEYVEAPDDWKLSLDNGWSKEKGLNGWKPINSSAKFVYSAAGAQIVRSNKDHDETGLMTTSNFEVPMRVDAVYKRARYGVGAGIRIHGVLIGEPVGANKQGRETLDTSIAQKDRNGKWQHKFIVRHPKVPSQPTHLRCYVTKDPSDPARARFSGFLKNENGKYFFHFGGRQIPAEGKIELLLGTGSVATFSEFKVFSPKQ